VTQSISQNRRKFAAICLLIAATVSAAVFLGFGLVSARRAAKLRDDICTLQPAKSNFDDASRVFRQYSGYVRHLSGVPPECSPRYCNYVLNVENPLSKYFRLGPRMGFGAIIEISNDRVVNRYLAIALQGHNEDTEVFVEQSAITRFTGDVRILRTGIPPRIGVQVSVHSSSKFETLARSLALSCLVRPGGCSDPVEILPFLRDEARKADGA
jgi:hypothetical protein